MSQLVTGEAVVLDLHEAAMPSRVLAALLDGLIQLAALLAFLLVLAAAPPTSDAAAAAWGVTVYLLIGLGYPVLLETLMHGRTPGKAALGLRVVRDDAGPIGFRQAFVRGVVGLIVERPGITFWSGAIITSLLNSRGKRLGDLLAGTVVVQERVSAPVAPMAMMPPPLAGWATTLDLSRLPDDLALSVRSYLARMPQLTESARADLGGRLAGAVAAVVTPAPPPGTPQWAYLQAVLAERRRRAEVQLGYGQPAPGRPVYGAPPPLGAAPVFGTAPAAGPAYGAPSYGAPSYGTPSYGTPSYGTPSYGAAPPPVQPAPSAPSAPPEEAPPPGPFAPPG